MALCTLIQERRRAVGWSREMLAVRAGVSVATVARVERGENPRPSTLVVLVMALGLTADDLAAVGIEDVRLPRDKWS